MKSKQSKDRMSIEEFDQFNKQVGITMTYEEYWTDIDYCFVCGKVIEGTRDYGLCKECLTPSCLSCGKNANLNYGFCMECRPN